MFTVYSKYGSLAYKKIKIKGLTRFRKTKRVTNFIFSVGRKHIAKGDSLSQLLLQIFTRN
jgi:hypothetical protein